MGQAVQTLMGYVSNGAGFDVPYSDIRDLQLTGLNERLQERVGMLKLVGHRAKEAGITEIRTLQDVVPLLLPHTAYKSYPESFLTDKKWDRLTKWLRTVSTHPIEVSLHGVVGMDDWVARLGEAGHFLSCSSGTTGKSALLMASQADVDFSAREGLAGYIWGSRSKPAGDRMFFAFAASASSPRTIAMGKAMFEKYGHPDKERFSYPVPRITVGAITEMIALRKSIADGTAKPGEVTQFEAESAARQKATDDAVGLSADAIIAARGEKLFIMGMWGIMFKVAEEVRKRGYGAADFHKENAIHVSGGLKRAQVPDNYREYIYDTFNIRPEGNFQMYGMQEIGSTMPRCQEGARYHIPPWVVCLPLDREGEKIMPGISKGAIEGRAAFFDLSLDGRWGGVISGDHIQVDYSPCACGAQSPSIQDNIYRYSDLQGDDKIACSGTIDAYVRGMS